MNLPHDFNYWFRRDDKPPTPEEALLYGCLNGVIGFIVMLVVLFVCFIFGGCCSHKQLVNETNNEEKDSVRVEIRYETVYVMDSVKVYIPAQTAERTTADSTSHLENDYAESDARINKDGTLYHDLRTKPQEKSVEFQKPIERKDSIIYRNIVKTKKETLYVEVPREYTWWDKTRFYGSYVLFALVALWLIRKYKGTILSFILKILFSHVNIFYYIVLSHLPSRYVIFDILFVLTI